MIRKTLIIPLIFTLWSLTVITAIAEEVEDSVLLREVTSREITTHVGGIGTALVGNVVSREITLYVGKSTEPPYARPISREISLVVTSDSPPGSVTELVARPNISGEGVTLDWSRYDEVNQHDVDHYLIYQSDKAFADISGMKSFSKLPAGTSTFEIHGLLPWKLRYFAVVAVDVLGNFQTTVRSAGSYPLIPQVISREVGIYAGAAVKPTFPQPVSREISLLVADSVPPEPIEDLQVQIDDAGNITLDWSTYDEASQADLVNYRILVLDRPFMDVSAIGSFLREVVVQRGTTSWTFSNLPKGKTLYFAVVPRDSGGNFVPSVHYAGSYPYIWNVISRELTVHVDGIDNYVQPQTISREVTVAVTDDLTPAAVTGIESGFTAKTSRSAFGAVELDWGSYDEVGQHDVLHYRIYVNTQFFEDVTDLEPFQTIPAERTSYTLTGLEGGEIFYVAVVAEDILGNYNQTVRAISVKASRSALGEVLKLSVTNLSDSLVFTWEPPEDADLFLGRYRIYFGGDLQPVVLDRNKTRYTATGLKESHGYSFRITTVDKLDKESLGTTLFAATLLANPEVIKVTSFNEMVRLEWTHVEPKNLVKHYGVYVNDSPFTSVAGMSPTRTTTGNRADITGLKNGTEYHFAVTTVNISDGERTEVESVRETPVIPTVPDLKVESITINTLPEHFGDPVESSFKVTNTGTASASTGWTDRLHLLPAGSVSGGIDLTSIDSGNVAPLAPQKSYTRTFSGHIPVTADMKSGDYVIVAQTDFENRLPESEEGNNSRVSQQFSLQLPPLPDLVITDIVVPLTGVPEEKINLSWTVTNKSSVRLDGSLRERVSLSSNKGDEGMVPLAEFTFNNETLDPGGSLVRTQKVTLPVDSETGDVYVVVTVDSDDDVIEEDETNNSAVSSKPIDIQAWLTLEVSTDSISENAADPVIKATITRNGNFSQPLNVAIAVDDVDELAVPSSVTIPVGQSTSQFDIRVIADGIIDGTQQVTVTANADGYQGDTAFVTVNDADIPSLFLQLDESIIPEGNTIMAQVSRDHVTDQPVSIFVTSSNNHQLTVPNFVTIPASEAVSPPFSLVAVDDTLPEIERSYTVSISSIGFTGDSKDVTVIDDDVPLVTITINVDAVSEGAGSMAAIGTVSRDTASREPLDIILSSDTQEAALVPDYVTILPDQASTTFPIAAVDDDKIDGTQEAVITATVFDKRTGQFLTEATPALLRVTDDDGPTLLLTSSRDLVAEGVEDAATLTVERNSGIDTDLTVTLTSSDNGEIIVPDTITLRSGESSGKFTVSSVEDGVKDGNVSVTITASAEGFATGSTPIVVSDRELPDLVIRDISLPEMAATEELVDFGYRIQNQGVITASGPILQRIFLSSDPVIGDDTLLEQKILTDDIPAELFFERSIPVRLPRVAGNYWLVVVTDVENSVSEIIEENNTTISAKPIHVTRAYTATVQTDVETGVAGKPVDLYGRAVVTGTDTPVPFVLVNIHIMVRDTKRIISALTDSQGNYTLTFQPLPGEGGKYQIGADHPGVKETSVQDTFTLLGMHVKPLDTITVLEGETTSGSFSLRNLSDVPLSGITATVNGKPSNLEVTVTVGGEGELPGLGEIPVQYSIKALSADTTEGVILLQLGSAEGVSTEAVLPITVEPLRSGLVTNPEKLIAGMVRGWQTIVEFEVTNRGAKESDPIQVLIPDLSWMSLISPDTLSSLQPGESSTVTLQLTPADDLTLGEYKGALVLNVTESSLSIPFSFRSLSEAKGDLRIKAVDEYTYYAEGSPKLAGALVTVKDIADGSIIAEGVTNIDGEALFEGLAENYYDVIITAEKHSTYRSKLLVHAGIVNEIEAFLSRQTVEYIWKVVPTEIEDRTKITIETVFEAFVPIPVITIEPALIDLEELTADINQIDLKITNHGLIAANNMYLYYDNHPLYKFEPLIEDIGTLSAKSSITVPLIIRRLNDTQQINPKSKSKNQSETVESFLDCLPRVGAKWELVCGPFGIWYDVPIPTIGFGEDCGLFKRTKPPKPNRRDRPYSVSPKHTNSNDCSCDPKTFEKVCGSYGFDWDLFVLKKAIKDAINAVAPPWFNLKDLGLSLKVSTEMCTCCKFNNRSLEGSVEGELEVLISILLGLSKEGDFLTYDPKDITGLSELGNIINVKQNWEIDLGIGLPVKSFVRVSGEKKCFEDLKGCVRGGTRVGFEPKFAAKLIFTFTDIEGKEQKIYFTGSILFKTGVSLFIEDCTDQERVVKACIEDLTFEVGVTGSYKKGNKTHELGLTVSKLLYEGNCNTHPSTELENGLISSVTPLASQQSNYAQNETSKQPTNLIENDGGGVCAQVRMQIDQEAVISRDAFNASVELINESESALEDIYLHIHVTDNFGTDVTDLFVIKSPLLTGISAVDGSGSILPGTNGKSSWTIIPTLEAAPEVATPYFVSGLLSYSQEGSLIEIPLTPASITVYPNANLRVHYFHQRDVFSDDPFTNEIEPSVPFTLGVLVQNIGKGNAKNVQIQSAQPRIIETEKGILIGFQIIDAEVSGQKRGPSLTTNFGDIGPGEIKVGRWLLTSTLQGLFVDYDAKFEHIDGLGDPRLSLIESVGIHEMIHQVEATGTFDDGLPDFLVNDVADHEDLPDTIYLSDGTTGFVRVVMDASVDGKPTLGDLEIELTAPIPEGWSYLRIPDPADDKFRLSRVVRSDGMEIPVDTNAWTTNRTFVGMRKKPLNENRLHLLDYNSTGRYTFSYTEKPAIDKSAPQSRVLALPGSSLAEIPVQWSGEDDTGVHSYDIFVSINNAPFIPWLRNTTLRGAVYKGEFGNSYAFYSVAKDFAGNIEEAPSVPDAVTSVLLENREPTLDKIKDITIAEGDTVSFTATAADPDGDKGGLQFSIDPGAPSGATIDPTTGELSWVTGEAHGGASYPITVRVTDNGSPNKFAKESFTITVEEVNTAPELSPIQNNSVTEGKSVTLQAHATDGDLPQQKLTFSLEEGAPVNAVIDPQSGLFTWDIPNDHGSQVHLITIKVTDNGDPKMSGTKEVMITVLDEDESPIIICPPNTTIFCSESIDPDENSSLGTATATDTCSGELSINYRDEITGETDCSSSAVIKRTWTATNDCGTSSSCVQTIFVENTLTVLTLSQGMNLFSYPSTVPDNTATCQDLLASIGTSDEIESISRFNTDTQSFDVCDFAGGEEFPIVNGEGYLIRMVTDKEVTLPGGPVCSDIVLTEGFNLIGHAAPPADLTSYGFLDELGADKVSSIQRFNPETGAFESCTFYFNEEEGISQPIGVNFPIKAGEGYIIHARVNSSVELPGCEN